MPKRKPTIDRTAKKQTKPDLSGYYCIAKEKSPTMVVTYVFDGCRVPDSHSHLRKQFDFIVCRKVTTWKRLRSKRA